MVERKCKINVSGSTPLFVWNPAEPRPILTLSPTLQDRLTLRSGEYEWKVSMRKVLGDKTRQSQFDPAFDP
jgi:hypothetical protein